MALDKTPIKRRLMLVVLLTSLAVLVLTSASFVIYELVSSRQELRRTIHIAAQIIAAQSTAPLMYQDPEEAAAILSSLRAAENILKAALYDTNNTLFAYYPTNLTAAAFPPKPPPAQSAFTMDRFIWCHPVVQNDKHVGMLWLESNLAPIYKQLELYSVLGAMVMAGSLLVAFFLSNMLQKGISGPILKLAETARGISQRRDYSLRAEKVSDDELGTLTDAFNHMLGQIQDRETALRDSADRLRLALQSAQIGAWDWHFGSNRVNRDEFICRQFGVPPDQGDVSYDEFVRRIHPEDLPKVILAAKEALSAHGELNAEFRVIWPDGAIRHLAARGKAIYDERGGAVRMTGVSLDVTDHRRAEEAHAFLASIVESSEDAIVGKDLSGTLISWNAGAERMFGYAPQEIIGQSVHILTSPDRPNEEAAILTRIRAGQRVDHFETVRICKDGTALEVALSVSPIRNGQGEVIGISSIARDITQRKRAEQVLARQASVLREQAQLLNLANVLARDLTDRIILWTAGMEQLYGWSKNEAIGKAAHELLSTHFPRPLAEIRESLFAQGEWAGELVQTRRSGERVIVASRWVLHRHESGEPAAILEVNNDITERKLAEEEIRRLNSDLEQRVRDRTAELTAANQELEAFTYSVSHDLRAPLRHIDAFARILQEETAADSNAEFRNYIDRIRKGTQTMGRLVDDLLNLSRVGRAQLGWQTVDLNAVVQEAITDLKPETAGRQIEWRVATLPVAQCDPGLIKQVFTNLLSNAVKYTRPRAIAVIEVGTTATAGQAPIIFVRDNGVGFNMKFVHKLFGVFERLHRAEEFEGTGIGLATIRRIIQKHGGHVWAEGEVNQGATFYFTLQGLTQANQPLPSTPESLGSTPQLV